MIPAEQMQYAQLLLEWSRSLPEHGLSWEAWLRRRGEEE